MYMKSAKKAHKTREKTGSPAKQIAFRGIKGAIYALILTIVVILVFAVIIKQAEVEASFISVVNQVIKIVCIILSAFIASKHMENGMAAAAGAVSGIIYILVGFLVFSMIEGNMGDLAMLGADAVMALIIGGVAGIALSKFTKTK